MVFPIVLLLALALPQTAPSVPKPDALALLSEVSQRYADAKSYHIEAVDETTRNNELSRQWEKTMLTAIVMPGNRYRYEGRSGMGDVIYISDGSEEWDYLPLEKVYVQRPAAGPDSGKKRVHLPQEIIALNAKSLVSGLAHRADVLKSATLLPDETISIGGKSIDCHVVHYADQDFKTQRPAVSRSSIIWIDKSRKVIVKIVDREQPLSNLPVNGFLPRSVETTVTYPVVELDQGQAASSFSFVPPADAKLVEAFSDAMIPGPHSEFVGKPAGDFKLKSADGKIISLSSYRGKPVFLDFWASWCGPCRSMVPDLMKLYAETEPKGLVWVAVDNDENPDSADKVVAQEHIPWPNYHDLDGSIGAAFHRNGLPLGVLIDERGQVAFYQSAYTVSDLRSSIAKLGPQFGSVASTGVSSK
ncbi:MAG: redoxin domain-containing protein [Candidatus Sulfotelmatobacter sp.]|jgi:thiol-disulfide isomerase/thioredoxin